MDEELHSFLATMIEEHSLSTVLDHVAMFCHSRAEAILNQRGDENTARAWTDAAGMVARVASKLAL